MEKLRKVHYSLLNLLQPTKIILQTQYFFLDYIHNLKLKGINHYEKLPIINNQRIHFNLFNQRRTRSVSTISNSKSIWLPMRWRCRTWTRGFIWSWKNNTNKEKSMNDHITFMKAFLSGLRSLPNPDEYTKAYIRAFEVCIHSAETNHKQYILNNEYYTKPTELRIPQ